MTSCSSSGCSSSLAFIKTGADTSTKSLVEVPEPAKAAPGASSSYRLENKGPQSFHMTQNSPGRVSAEISLCRRDAARKSEPP